MHASATQLATVTPVRAGSLHVSKPTWWLESRFHFSFADWYEPSLQGWGALRVVNDDLVKGNSGFGTHPHRDMEIFTYVVDGELSHADSMGTRETLSRGAVQYMSAGTGVRHSEMNDGAATCRFLQIWIQPDQRGHKPQYGSSKYAKQDRHNSLLQILGGTGPAPDWQVAHVGQPIHLHQDANVYVSESDGGHVMEVEVGPKRQIYAVCIEGDLAMNDVQLSARDAARVVGTGDSGTRLKLEALKDGAHFLLVEMAQPL